MTESLSWLGNPETEYGLSDLLHGLIDDIRLILVRKDLGHAARLAAITQAVDQLAPPPGRRAGVARSPASLVALLACSTGPATVLLEELAGERIRIDLAGAADRPLTEAECLSLRMAPGARGHQRTGCLRAVGSGLVAAEVHSVVIPGRLPASARAELGIRDEGDASEGETATAPSGIPLGKVLAGLGVRREPLGARLVRDGTTTSGDRVSVESSARMWLAGTPVALAGERLTAEFCRRVVGRPGPR